MEVILDLHKFVQDYIKSFWNIGFIDRRVKLKSLLSEEMLT